MEAIICRGLRLGSNLRPISSFLINNGFSPARCLCCTDPRYWIFGANENNARYKSALRSYFLFSHDHFLPQRTLKTNVNNYGIALAYSKDSQKQSKKDCDVLLPSEKLSLFQKMKQLTKDYWHILIPVHLVTSMCWVTVFYMLIKNGVDVVGILEKMNLSERYLEMLRNSGAGNWALTYALYKLCTPARYAVTIGGTTMSIRYLSRLGYLKTSAFKKAATNPRDETLRKTVTKIYSKAQN